MTRRALLLLAGLLLPFASAFVWQHRFELVPGALPATRLADPLVGWAPNFPGCYRILDSEDGGTFLRLERRGPDEPVPGLGIWLHNLKGVDYLYVRCEGRWKDVVRGPQPYNDARFAITPRTRDGLLHYPPEGDLILGLGSSDWRSAEVVFGLDDSFVEVGVRMGVGGDSGQLDLRNVSLVGVRQRGWVPLAIAGLFVAWTVLAAAMVLPPPGKPARARRLVVALLVVAFAWIMVFPKVRDHYHPLIGGFSVAGLPSLPNGTRADSGVAPDFNFQRMPQRSGQMESPHTVHGLLEEADHRLGALHLVVFTAFTLLTLSIAGNRSPWPLLLGLAVLSEVIPNLVDRNADLGDLLDLAENLAGIGIGLLLWVLARRLLVRLRPLPDASPP